MKAIGIGEYQGRQNDTKNKKHGGPFYEFFNMM